VERTQRGKIKKSSLKWQKGDSIMNSSIKMVKGNYVIHFLQLLAQEDKGDIDNGYSKAIANAKPFGGRKFHNKNYGGGIAFDYLSEAEAALEHITGMYLCPNCRNELVHNKGEYCLTCDQSIEELEKEKDAQRQAYREKYNTLNIVWVYIIDYRTGIINWLGEMNQGDAEDKKRDGIGVYMYPTEKSYNEMKEGHRKAMEEITPLK
jgi:hypothetical protein